MLDECAILFLGIKKDSVKSISAFYAAFRLCNALNVALAKRLFFYCRQRQDIPVPQPAMGGLIYRILRMQIR